MGLRKAAGFFFLSGRLEEFPKTACTFSVNQSNDQHVSRMSNEVELRDWTKVLNKPLITNCFLNVLLFHKQSGSTITSLFLPHFPFS